MPIRRRAFGDLGERLAAQHLEAKGYRIVERNYRRAEGEIDIIARGERHAGLRRSEVAARLGMGTAGESITPAKAARMVALAEAYADERRAGRCAAHRPDRDRLRAGRAAAVAEAQRERCDGRLSPTFS